MKPFSSPPIARLGVVACVALSPHNLGATPTPPGATPSIPTTTGPASIVASPTLEVDLDPTISDAETLSQWIHQDGLDALAQLEPEPRRGTISVSVFGSLYDYEVSITSIREGSADRDTISWACECSNDDMLARIRTDIQAAAKVLEIDDSDVIAEAAPTPQPFISDNRSGQLSVLQLRGKIGLSLIAGGGAGILSGVVLTAVGKRSREAPQDSAWLTYKNYRVPGVPTLVVGVGLLTAGMVLFVQERRRSRLRRSLAVIPLVLAGSQGVDFGLMRKF